MRWLLIMVLLPSFAFASENCVTQFGGKCRDACAPNEYEAEGAFIDCAEKEQCCVEKEASKTSSPASAPEPKSGPASSPSEIKTGPEAK
ncbi:MAG: hypothetical protein HZA17_06320 [Nitrospirae bacterium]|nr:hypothetical protein [Nitrospirota bacterium]